MPTSPRHHPYVTQKDIARLANVSQSAVAAALGRTDKIQVSEETRRKVLQAAAQLNYTPNQSASITRRGRSRQIAILTRGTMLKNVFTRVQALSEHLKKHGFQTIPRDLDLTCTGLEQAWNEALAARAEGIVLASSFGIMAPEMHRLILNSPVPVVSLCGPQVPGIPLVAPDFRQAFHDLTARLAATYGDVALLRRLRKPDPIVQIEWKRSERLNGYLDAMKEAGRPSLVHDALNRSEPYVPMGEFALGEQGVNELLDGPRRPHVIVCSNDNLAFGGLTAAIFHRKLKVPEELAITGCDGEGWTGYGAMPLTTIIQPSTALATRAGEILIAMLERGSQGEVADQFLPCEILWRASCPEPSPQRPARRKTRNG